MSRGRVLLLQDDPALRGLLQEALETEDFEVLVCDAYRHICDAAAAGLGDVIVADFWGKAQRTLGDLERQEIAALSRLLPMVLLTGRSWAVDVTAEELGARALMRKPFDLDVLIGAIQAALDGARS